MGDIAKQSRLPISRIGAYEIEGLLGRGSMANVYVGRHEDDGRVVALKVMHAHWAGDRTVTARFFREARALARVVHPNIAEVLDVREDGVPYFVMPLIEGEDLRQYMRRSRPMSLQQLAECMLPVVDAVAAAHAAGIVHRDLKPSNIRLTRDASGMLVPKVLDFGISKLEEEDRTTSALTETGVALGTVDYTSPEQLRSAKDADARSDIYAIGVILYECAAGRRPFHGESTYDLMHAILTSRAAPPSFFRKDIPPEYDAMVLRAIAPKPSDRFASARELGVALAAFSAHPKGCPPKRSQGNERIGRASGFISVRTLDRKPIGILVASTARSRLIRAGDLDVHVWLHTFTDPTASEWTRGCEEMALFVRARKGDVSNLRIFALTDGGAPNALQRRELNVDALGGHRIKIAVLTRILKTSRFKRGIATALTWLNPEVRFFEPQEVLRALDHLGISFAQFDPIWTCLTELQRSLPPIRALQLIANELCFPSAAKPF